MPRRPTTVEIPSLGSLDRNSGQVGRQLAHGLRNAIKNGELKPGEPLPSTRTLTNALRLARGTVMEAFDQLVAEGFLEARTGTGTRVSMALQGSAPLAQPPHECTTPNHVETKLPPVARQLADVAR